MQRVPGEKGKQARAQELFEEEVAAGRAALSTQVLQEFYWAVTRQTGLPSPPEVAEERVRDFSGLTLVQVNAPMILAAISRSRRLGFSFWDALILEAELVAGTNRLLTGDFQHSQVIEGLRVENPFL